MLKFPGIQGGLRKVKHIPVIADVAIIIQEWEVYLDGYRKVISIVEDHLKDPDLAFEERNMMVIPLFFLYRHSIELNLKILIIHSFKNNLTNSEPKKTHDLMENWEISKKILKDNFAGVENDDLDLLGQSIKDFHEYDPLSFAFRYPEDKHGNPPIKLSRSVSVPNIMAIGNGICETLGKCIIAVKDF